MAHQKCRLNIVRVAVVGWAVLVSSVLLTTAEAAAEPAKVPLGQAVPAPAGSVVAGALSSQTPLHIDVVMAPQNPGGLTSFIKDLYDPASPDYHHFLARGQFGPEFGAAPATIQAVTSTLGGMGLHVDSVSPNDLVVSVTATAGQAEEAFGVHIREYHLPSGISRFANTSAPLVPSAIRSDLIGVTGLSNVAPAVPLAVHSSPRSS